MLALGWLAYATARRGSVLIGIPAGIALLAALVAAPGPLDVSNVVGNVLAVVFTMLVGDLLRVRRHQNALLARRNRELQALREAETRSAIVEERMRIAREVHDVVGHSLVAITLQARAGLRRLSRSPERAGQALHEIEALAARALDETRTAVSTMRGSSDLTARYPPPALGDLADLVESMRDSDLDVHIDMDPATHDLPPRLQWPPTGSCRSH